MTDEEFVAHCGGKAKILAAYFQGGSSPYGETWAMVFESFPSWKRHSTRNVFISLSLGNYLPILGEVVKIEWWVEGYGIKIKRVLTTG